MDVLLWIGRNWHFHSLYLLPDISSRSVQSYSLVTRNLALHSHGTKWCKISITKLDSCIIKGKSTQGSYWCSWCLDLWCHYSLCHESTRGKKSNAFFIMVMRVRIGHLTKQVICPNSQLVFCKMMCNDFNHATLPFANKYNSHFFGCCIVSVMKPLNSHIPSVHIFGHISAKKFNPRDQGLNKISLARDMGLVQGQTKSKRFAVCAMATKEKVNYQLFMCALNIPIGYSFEEEGGSQTLFISTIRQ